MEEEYRKLREDWDAGKRSREDGLRLLFLAWMHWADPSFVTGLSEDPRAQTLWHDVFAHFGGEGSSDAEFLHVAGMMARVFPPDPENWDAWVEAGRRMTSRSLELSPDGFSPELFKGRGEYGDYFEGQARDAPTHVWFPDWLKQRH